MHVGNDVSVELKGKKLELVRIQRTPTKEEQDAVYYMEQTIPVQLKEESPSSMVLIGKVKYYYRRLESQRQSLSIHAGDYIEVKYGHGYFEKSAKLLLE